MQNLRTLISSALLTCAVGGGGFFLFRLRSAARLPGPGELMGAPPEEAVYGAVWLLAVLVTAWVALTGILSVFAYAARIPAAIRAVEWMTIPPIRRLARRTAALALTATAGLSMTTAAGAIQPPPTPFMVGPQEPAATAVVLVEENHGPPAGMAAPIPLRAGEDGPDTRPRTVNASPIPASAAPISAAAPVPMRVGENTLHHPQSAMPYTPSPAVPIPLRAGEGAFSDAAGGAEGTTLYTVQPGDNMWSITAAYLSDGQDAAPSVDRITEVWRKVVALNRDRIISGNPDLIFPGEQLLLPPLGETR